MDTPGRTGQAWSDRYRHYPGYTEPECTGTCGADRWRTRHHRAPNLLIPLILGGRFETPEEFGAVVVRANPDGSQVLLRDIARIELGIAKLPVQTCASTGRASSLVQVFQLPDANGLDVAEKVIATMDRIFRALPRTTCQYVISLDTTKPIIAGIREIVITPVSGGLSGHSGRLYLPAERALHAHTHSYRPGLTDRRAFAVFPAAGFFYQYPVTAWPCAGDRYRRRRCDCSW